MALKSDSKLGKVEMHWLWRRELNYQFGLG
jgi:hypothetical protein